MTRLSSRVTRKLHDVTIMPLSETHLSEIWPLWRAQYDEALSNGGVMPDRWNSRREETQSFLRKRVKSDYAVVAKNGKEIIGYMLFDVFPFHGEKTAFCPIAGHAVKQVYRRQVFEKLYQNLSRKLVANGILNHIITYFAHDDELERTVFELGFGLIVIDAFRKLNTFPSRVSSTNIIKADSSHLDDIAALGEESRSYYLEAPIFLTREKRSRDYYRSLLGEDSAIFLASSDSEPVGVMQIRKNQELDAITLSDLNTSLIDKLGAYIKPKYRRQGIGRALLLRCIQWCQLQDIDRIHVDFESANLLARSFWLRHFTAAMHSAKRTINRDVPQTQKT